MKYARIKLSTQKNFQKINTFKMLVLKTCKRENDFIHTRCAILVYIECKIK